MPPKKARAAGGPAGPKAHQLAELMPPGEVLVDFCKGSWRVGAKLGQGGFGLIYLGECFVKEDTSVMRFCYFHLITFIDQ